MESFMSVFEAVEFDMELGEDKRKIFLIKRLTINLLH